MNSRIVAGMNDFIIHRKNENIVKKLRQQIFELLIGTTGRQYWGAWQNPPYQCLLFTINLRK